MEDQCSAHLFSFYLSMCAMPNYLRDSGNTGNTPVAYPWLSVTLSRRANILQSKYVPWWECIHLTGKQCLYQCDFELWNPGMVMFRENEVFDWPQPPDHTEVSTEWHTDGEGLKVQCSSLVLYPLSAWSWSPNTHTHRQAHTYAKM